MSFVEIRLFILTPFFITLSFQHLSVCDSV